MKLRNILSVFCFLAAMASCSMEDDTMMNDASKEFEASVNADKEAYLAFGMNLGVMNTKSTVKDDQVGTDDKIDQEINNLWIFLLDGETVLNKAYLAKDNIHFDAEHHLYKDAEHTTPFGFLTKKKDNLKLFVIANSTYTANNATIAACTTLSGIKALSLGADDLNACVKVSDVANVVWGNYPGYEKINGADGALLQEPCWVDVTLKQAYARVGLKSFVVKKSDELTDNIDVTLLEATLSNQNMAWSVGGAGQNISKSTPSYLAQGASYTCNTASITDNEGLNLISGELAAYRTFQNETETPVSINLKYQIGVNVYEKTYPIKTAYEAKVLAGNIYQLNVIMTVADREADVVVSCYTEDWKEGGALDEIVLKPSNN
ncbi:hypothetical protein H8784_19050 [Parabacteroides acidifaciens]|uniref:Uncharacterized protein n=1 Tax=Parabacteroides acidifaciens TaxID=2290935 RepID=A0A3D8H8Y7_9BACT|nr:fimbrial protein [Parabacteroides acidifaciens]MBC8603810.1 hypothetical protein [Parabacteroides acidifaciens]RDU47436.1 hypothetical protein DWU89_19555 [Parabacteroides acidifaciens]